MHSEEVEDEILALVSIYEDQFSRTADNQIRAIIKPEAEDQSVTIAQGVLLLPRWA